MTKTCNGSIDIVSDASPSSVKDIIIAPLIGVVLLRLWPFFSPSPKKGHAFFVFFACVFFVFVLLFLFELKKKRWESVRRLKVVRKRGKDWKKEGKRLKIKEYI